MEGKNEEKMVEKKGKTVMKREVAKINEKREKRERKR